MSEFPSALEYFAYMFNCFGIISGPFVFFTDFIACINQVEKKSPTPYSLVPVVKNLFFGFFFLAVFWFGDLMVPCEVIVDPDYIASTALWQRALYIYVALFIARSKYYAAWLICESCHNAAGIGFNGYNRDGSPKWDLVKNIRIRNIEFATGLKSYIDNWNIRTTIWIRHVAYERLPSQYKTMGSFFLSAVWHGFLPGYYLMFFTCHIFLHVQRKVRRSVRPIFQTTKYLQNIYEILTFFVTQFTIVYGVVPFVLLELEASFKFYNSVYYVGHFIGIILLLIVPGKELNSKKFEKVENLAGNRNIREQIGGKQNFVDPQFALKANQDFQLRHR